MKLFSCYHPVLVTNKYTGKQVLARCGKCPACINARSAQWVQRLDLEMQAHPYTFFVTFQYDEQNVNQLIRLRDCDSPSNLPCYIDSDTGFLVSLKDCPGFTQADINYCNNTKILLVHNVRDFQLFMKSLRKKLKEDYNATIRYYSAFEYGPQTFRPHIHSLFFLDSPQVAENFVRLLSDYWSYGCVFDPHLVNGSANAYVAAYLNCNVRLPKIYLHPNIKQKALFSKCPPIGSSDITKETFQQFFNKGINSFTIYRKDLHKFCDVPLFRFIQNRLYPKITAFDRLTHYDRVALYRLGCLSIVARGQKLADYISEYLHQDYFRPYFECAFKTPNARGMYHFNVTSFNRFLSAVSRVAMLADRFNVSIEDYVTAIENFYDLKQRQEFYEFLRLQNEYFEDHPVSDFLIFNPNFYITTKGKKYSDLKDWQRFYLDLYMPNRFKGDDVINYGFNDAFCYREMRSLHDKIFFDNTKRKESNDYLLAHRDKFDNIITYNNEIENFVSNI